MTRYNRLKYNENLVKSATFRSVVWVLYLQRNNINSYYEISSQISINAVNIELKKILRKPIICVFKWINAYFLKTVRAMYAIDTFCEILTKLFIVLL